MFDDVAGGGASTAVEVEELPKLESMSEADRTAYLKDGTLPTKKAEDDTSDGGKAAKAAAESGAAPDAADNDTKGATDDTDDTGKPAVRESRSQRRIRKQNDEIKELRAKLAEKDAQPPAVKATVTADTSQPSKAPKLKSFTDKIGAKDGGYPDWEAAHEAYEDAVDAHHENLRKTAVRDALKAEQDTLDTKKAQELADKTTNKNAKAFADRSVEFRKTLKVDNFGDMFMEVKEALDEAIAVRPELAELSTILVKVEEGPAMVYYYGEHPEELDALLEMSLSDALLEVGQLKVSDKIKAPPAKTITAAKKKGTDVSGRQAIPEDPIEAAVEKNDVKAFIDESNKKEGGAALRWGGR